MAASAGPIGMTGSAQYTRIPGYYPVIGAYGGGEITLYNYTSIDNDSYSASSKDIGNVDPSLQTFCLEHSEAAVTPMYFVVGSAAQQGGTATSDPLSKGASWLYSQFARGTLSVPLSGGLGDYFSAAAPVRGDEALALQNAIWALEDDIAAPVGNPYYDAALLNGGKADADPGENGVYVLNNFRSAAARDAFVASGALRDKAQDFLWFRVPDTGATLVLLGAGMLGLGFFRRREA